MRRRLLVFSIVVGMCLVSCGRSEQTSSGITKEESKTDSGQKVQNNTLDTNQSVAVSGLDYPEYEDAKSLVKASDAIFSGKVLGIMEEDLNISKEKDAEKLPYIVYEVKIDTMYQGEISENIIKIKHLNAGTENNVSNIAEGDSYLFLVKQYNDSYPSLLNASQSYFALDAKQENSTNKETDKEEISLDDVMAVILNN